MYAVIDIGSNTIRLVLYRMAEGRPRQILSSKASAGLAGYVEKNGCLSSQGIEKAIEVLRQFKQVLEEIQPEKAYFFATASLRNVANTEEVVEAITDACGITVQVLSGKREALLDYYGALQSIPQPEGLLVDIGGGSTELVFFQQRQALLAVSLPIGSLNLSARFVQAILPDKKEFAQLSAYVQEQLEEMDFPLPPRCSTAFLCGVGGTCRASCKLSDQLFGDSAGYAGYPCQRLGELFGIFRQEPQRFLQAMIKSAPDRLHTLVPGLVILDAVSRRFRCETFSASPYGVREGYLLYRLEAEQHA